MEREPGDRLWGALFFLHLLFSSSMVDDAFFWRAYAAGVLPVQSEWSGALCRRGRAVL